MVGLRLETSFNEKSVVKFFCTPKKQQPKNSFIYFFASNKFLTHCVDTWHKIESSWIHYPVFSIITQCLTPKTPITTWIELIFVFHSGQNSDPVMSTPTSHEPQYHSPRFRQSILLDSNTFHHVTTLLSSLTLANITLALLQLLVGISCTWPLLEDPQTAIHSSSFRDTNNTTGYSVSQHTSPTPKLSLYTTNHNIPTPSLIQCQYQTFPRVRERILYYLHPQPQPPPIPFRPFYPSSIPWPISPMSTSKSNHQTHSRPYGCHTCVCCTNIWFYTSNTISFKHSIGRPRSSNFTISWKQRKTS